MQSSRLSLAGSFVLEETLSNARRNGGKTARFRQLFDVPCPYGLTTYNQELLNGTARLQNWFYVLSSHNPLHL